MPYQQQTLTMQNGTELVLRVFEHSGAPCASVIIPAAMGVAQNYWPLVPRWLAA